MFLRMIYDEKLAQAAYLIGCTRTGEAVVIDPERDVDRYLDAAGRAGLRVSAVAETHFHADFLSGARELAERAGARLYLSGEGGPKGAYRWLREKQGGGQYPHRLLRDGDTFRVGGVELVAVHTPGHTPEQLSFLVTDRGGGATAPMGIVTGDFVLVGDLGRPETAAGEEGAEEAAARRLFASIERFLALPEYLQVWPGHGAGGACGRAPGEVPQTTVGYERRFNEALVHADRGEEAFVSAILSGRPEPPPYFARMKRLNRDGAPVLGPLPVPMHVTPVEVDAASGEEETVVLDTRPWASFREHHLPGALFAPRDRSFPTVAGSFVDPEARLYLVAERAEVEELVRELVRVGLDRVAGFMTADDLDAYRVNGGEMEATPEIEPRALRVELEAGALALDVRGAAELEAGAVPGAVNVACVRLPEQLERLPRDRQILVYSATGARSAIAAAFLRKHGFGAVNVAGGYEALRAEQAIPSYEIVTGPPAVMG